VEPASSQSSTSEDSSNQRQKYCLPPTSKRPIVETVSSLKEAASASITDLKEWAAIQTRSAPIEAITPSSSSSFESLLDSKPPTESHRGRRKTKHAPIVLKKTPTPSSESREVLLESANSFKDAASSTVNGIKEWAVTLPKSRDSTVEAAAKETKLLYDVGREAASPERATRTLYGAQTGYESMQQQNEKSANHSLPKNPRAPCSPRLRMMQDLVSPFLVCTSGAAQSVKDEVEPTTYPVDYSLKDRIGEPVKESVWSNWNPTIGALDHRADSFDESILTYDSEAEEQEQIRRMTSWGTMGTMGTLGTQNTALTMETTRTQETSDGTIAEAALFDDEGNAINPVLLEKAKRHREQRKKKKGRKRLVKFDYPPISSLRECPRADPADLPNLFFTEDELDQIEDDRFNTKTADDVEIVAISSIKSGDGSLSDSRDSGNDSSSSKVSPPGGSFSKYTSTPKLRNKRRPSSPFPRRPSALAQESNESFECENEKPPKTPSSSKLPGSSPSASSSQREQRLLKGVQIFLRERSTGCERM
jgi:hypothetical protein